MNLDTIFTQNRRFFFMNQININKYIMQMYERELSIYC